MPIPDPNLPTTTSCDSNWVDEQLKLQLDAWEAGEPILLEKIIGPDQLETLLVNQEAALSLIYNEVCLRESAGEKVSLIEYQIRFPVLAEELAIQWQIDRMMRPAPIESDNSVGSTQTGTPCTPNIPHGHLKRSRLAIPSHIGRYEIQRELGRGAVGIVYEAWDPKLKRSVAIKRLRSGIDASEEELQRMRSEAEAIAHIRHAHVVQIYDVGEVDGEPFLAMELCHGGNLATRLNDKPLTSQQSARLVQQIAQGVAAAHQSHVIHRDLKPSNVLLEDKVTWTPKVTDFGLAKLLDQDGLSTATGNILGTPTYMPPEQALGSAKRANASMDIYGIGAILYECLTGRPPFRALNIAETLKLVRDSEPISIRRLEPSVPIDLETIAIKCLRKEPEKRYASVEDLIDDLQRFLDLRPVLAQRRRPIEYCFVWCRRNLALTSSLAIVAIVVLSSLAILGWMNLRIRSEALEKSAALLERTKAFEEKSVALAEREIAYLQSKKSESLANRRLYTANISLAQHALSQLDLARAEDLLLPSDRDLSEFKGFEFKLLHNDLMGYREWASTDRAGEIMGIDFSQDGQWIVGVGGNFEAGYVRLIDAETGKTRAHVQLNFVANACSFSPNASLFAVVNATGMSIRTVPEASVAGFIDTKLHGKSVLWSADGKRLFVGSENGKLGIWSAEDYSHIATLNAEQGPILRMFFSADQSRLYTSTDWGGQGKHSTRWDLTTDIPTRTKEFEGISLTDESKDGRAVSGMHWGELRIADALNGKLIQSLHHSTGPLHSVRFHDDDKSLLLAARTDRELRVLSRDGLAVQRVFQVRSSLAAVAIDSQRQRFLTGDAAGEIRMWKTTRDTKHYQQTDVEHLYRFASFLPNGTDVLLGSLSPTQRWTPDSSTLQPFHAACDVATSSRDGMTLVSNRADVEKATELEVWRAGSTKPMVIRLPNPIYERCLLVSPSGRWLATRSEGEPIHIFDLQDSKPEPAYRLSANCFCFDFSPDEKLLVCAAQNGEIPCFDLTSGKTLASFAPKQTFWAWGLSCTFSQDGKYVASGNESGIIHVWDTQTRALVSRLVGNQGEVRCLAFFPDGSRIVSGGTGDLRLWDVVAGQELISLPTPDKHIQSIAVSDHGDAVLALGKNGQVRVWRTE